MAKKRGCNRHPGSSRCLKQIDGLNCTSKECARNTKNMLENKKAGQSSEIKDEQKVVGKYCADSTCFREALLSEKVCTCGSTDFILRYAEEHQGVIDPDVGLCVKHPKLGNMRTFCPIPA